MEKAKVVFGDPVLVDGKTVCPLAMVSDVPRSPTVRGLFHKQDDGLVMIWSQPGQNGPLSIRPEANPKARILNLEKAE